MNETLLSAIMSSCLVISRRACHVSYHNRTRTPIDRFAISTHHAEDPKIISPSIPEDAQMKKFDRQV